MTHGLEPHENIFSKHVVQAICQKRLFQEHKKRIYSQKKGLRRVSFLSNPFETKVSCACDKSPIRLRQKSHAYETS